MSDIRFRFATTLVTSKIANPANTSQEVRFDVTLPDEAFISDFQMYVIQNVSSPVFFIHPSSGELIAELHRKLQLILCIEPLKRKKTL